MVESVMQQSVTDWELIFIDDASVDGTADFIEKRFAGNACVQVIRMSRNGGPSAARNTGISAARGTWIALLDADDAWVPDRLEMMLQHEDGADFIADNLLTYDATAGLETGAMFEQFDGNALTLEDLLVAWVGQRKLDAGYLKPLMRAEFLRAKSLLYKTALRHGEDFVLYCEALCQRARFVLLDYYGYIYTTPVGKMSNSISQHSQTSPDGAAMARELTSLKNTYSSKLSSRELRAFDRTIYHLLNSKKWWEFEEAIRNRRIAQSLSVMLQSHVVRTYVWKALSRRIRRQQPSRPALD
jgi:succinoglycan biosynthesis protein ExoO